MANHLTINIMDAATVTNVVNDVITQALLPYLHNGCSYIINSYFGYSNIATVSVHILKMMHTCVVSHVALKSSILILVNCEA